MDSYAQDRNALVGSLMTHLEEAKGDLEAIVKRSKNWSVQSPIHRSLKVLQKDMAMLNVHALQVLNEVRRMDAKHRTLEHRQSDHRPEMANGPTVQPRDSEQKITARRTFHRAIARDRRVTTEVDLSGLANELDRPNEDKPQMPQPSSENAKPNDFLTSVSRTASGLPPEMLRRIKAEQESH